MACDGPQKPAKSEDPKKSTPDSSKTTQENSQDKATEPGKSNDKESSEGAGGGHENCGCDHASLGVSTDVLKQFPLAVISASSPNAYLQFETKDNQTFASYVEGSGVEDIIMEDALLLGKDIEIFKNKEQCDYGIFQGKYTEKIRQKGEFCGTNSCYQIDPLDFTVIHGKMVAKSQPKQACSWTHIAHNRWKLYLFNPDGSGFVQGSVHTLATIDPKSKNISFTFEDQTFTLPFTDLEKPIVTQDDANLIQLTGTSLDGKSITHLIGKMQTPSATYLLIGLPSTKEVPNL